MKNLVVIALGRNTSEAFHEQLHKLLGNRVNIQYYYFGKQLPEDIQADLLLFSSKDAAGKVHIPEGLQCPILIARRAINYHEVGKLLAIPQGTDVLLVNDLVSSTNQTIALLQTLGINHINYHPYAPNIADYPRLKIAVTPGEYELVPDFVEEIIDIKTRQIDITTLVELLIQLDLLDFYADFLSANYMQDIIRLTKESHGTMQESERMKVLFQTVIDTVHDGIIATDAHGLISVMNPVAEELLKTKSATVIGMKEGQIKEGDLAKIINGECLPGDTLLTVNGHGLIVNTAQLYTDGHGQAKVYTFKDVSEIRRLEERVRRKFVQEQKVARYTFDRIIGRSAAIRSVLQMAEKMAGADATILIQGESGTGKELLAQSIHNASVRKNGPFVAVNFAALTESLLESELFGYVEGAFTGAQRGGAAGLFEEAHKGTIFLDEIGDAPLPFQVKLLRVLQEQQVRRVGSAKVIPIDVRVIVATNRDLRKLIAEGRFRQDLYYRLHVLPLRVPPLHERHEDIFLLAKHFYEQNKRSVRPITAELYFERVLPYLQRYNWPGNIRELQNLVEYLVNVYPDEIPIPENLPEEIYGDSQGASFCAEQEDSWKILILTEIQKANAQGRAIGRRSLSQKLKLPENRVRLLLTELSNEGKICMQRGRSGLKFIK